MSVPDEELTPNQLSRRGMLRRTGLLGAGLAASSVLAGAAAGATPAFADSKTGRSGTWNGDFLWLAGDHHIHTQSAAATRSA